MQTIREMMSSYPECIKMLEAREVLVRAEAFAEGYKECETVAAQHKHLEVKYRKGAPPLVPWLRGYRRYSKCSLFEAREAYDREFGTES